MAISQYQVGQIPLRNLTISVLDSTGTPVNCEVYTEITVRMLGSDNEEIDLTGAVLNRGAARGGRFTFEFPRDRSVFTETGDYVFQLVLKSATAVDLTTSHTIRVRELGGVNR